MLCVKAYNDWMVEEWSAGTGRPPHPVVPDPALGSVGRGRRGPSQRRPRRARRVLQRDPVPPRPAQHPRRRPLGSVLRRVRGDRHGRVHAHRLVVEDAGHLTRRTRVGAGDAELQQRHGIAERLPLLGRARAPSPPQARLQRGSDRVDPLHPRAGRRRLEPVPGLGVPPRAGARAAVDLLLPAGLRLLLPRPPRHPLARRGGRRQHHLRGRLPPLRLDLAQHQGRRRGSVRRRSTTRRPTRSCAATPSGCCTSTSSSPQLAGPASLSR